MRVDRKLLLILPTVVLVLVTAGLFYTASRLQLIVRGSDDLARRTAFIAAVDRGEKHLTTTQALGIIHYSLEAEGNRTAAIIAVHDLLQLVAWITLACCVLLIVTIRRIPRQGAAVSRPAPGLPGS